MLESVAGTGKGVLTSLYARYAEVAGRDPREFPLGYLAADGATGAIAPFLWFRDQGELLRFVATTELGLLRLTPPVHVDVTRALAKLVRRQHRLDRLAAALTAAFDGWTEILWVGSFADLCGAADDVPAATRAELRRQRDGTELEAALTPEELPDMVGLLRTQAASCCGGLARAAAAGAGAERRLG